MIKMIVQGVVILTVFCVIASYLRFLYDEWREKNDTT